MPYTADIGSAIFSGQHNEMLAVNGAGDAGHAGGCNVSGMGESPCTLVVGELGGACDETNYGTSTCDIASISGLGGMLGTTNGFNLATLSVVSLVVPGSMSYCLGITSDTNLKNTSCGTGSSFSNPQVAGAAIMVKDYMLTNGYTGVADEGRISVIIQAMGDRATSNSTYSNSGYDNLWGGGRFQLRNIGNMGAPYYWAMGAHVMSNGQSLALSVNGTGGEPSSIGQFKEYAMVFEEDNLDMSQFYLDMYDQDCGLGGTNLASDHSTDVHHMVHWTNSSGVSKALCTSLNAHYVPSGETRKVHTFKYYSGPTSMR